MGRIATLARRTFIVGVGAVAAGLAVGTYFYKRDPKNPLLDELPDGATAFNPYVRIDKDGITLITPRADIGQGAYSVQAALIAEELDLAWGQFNVDHGPPSAAYYNGVVAAEAMPIAATSESFFARMGRGAGDVVGKLVGMQITGGSSTVPDAFDKLRVAGAVARQMLLQAAAQQTGVPIAQLKTQDAHVITPDGKRLSYLSLAAAAGKQSPPSSVTLKPAGAMAPAGQADEADRHRGEVHRPCDVWHRPAFARHGLRDREDEPAHRRRREEARHAEGAGRERRVEGRADRGRLWRDREQHLARVRGGQVGRRRMGPRALPADECGDVRRGREVVHRAAQGQPLQRRWRRRCSA